MTQFIPFNQQISADLRVMTLPQNTSGRDFVVGDIHGAYDVVVEAMSRAKFCAGVDRLICVGDLVDRGAQSHVVDQFLSLPGVHAVRGNHEEFLMSITDENFDVPTMLHGFIKKNGGKWWIDLLPDRRKVILEAFVKLPYAIEVPTRRGLIGVVHAEVPAGQSWETFKRKVRDLDPYTVECALESRDRIGRRDASGVPGLDRLFVGHTINWTGLKRLGNVYAIDTGAVFGARARIRPVEEICETDGHLTMANIVASTGVLLAPPNVIQDEFVRFLDDQESPQTVTPSTQPAL